MILLYSTVLTTATQDINEIAQKDAWNSEIRINRHHLRQPGSNAF